jgi:hypothetical protein
MRERDVCAYCGQPITYLQSYSGTVDMGFVHLACPVEAGS